MINMQNNMKMVLMINGVNDKLHDFNHYSTIHPQTHTPCNTTPPGLNSKLIIVNPVPIKSLTHLTKISQLSSNAVHLQLT